MRVLFLSQWYPYPPNNGSKIRIANVLDALCRTHEVTLLSFFDPDSDVPEGPLPAVRPKEISLWPYRGYNAHSFRASLGYFSRTPRYLIDTHSSQMERIIARTVHRKGFDLVIASQLSMAAYHRAFQAVPAIFEEAELALLLSDSEPSGFRPRALRRRLTWAKHHRYMDRTVRNFHACTVASEAERRLLEAAVPNYPNIHTIPNMINLAEYGHRSGDRTPHSLVFTGSLQYRPNYDAMAWFVGEVYPRIKASAPDAGLTITGDPGLFPRPTAPGVVYSGRIADVRPIVSKSAASIVPILQGGGTRLKILESMALGTPVIATSKGAEGLEFRDGEHLLLADTPEQFAGAVLSVLRDARCATAMAENAYALLRARYDSRIVLPQFLRLVEALPGAPEGWNGRGAPNDFDGERVPSVT